MNLFETTCSKLVEDKLRYQALLRRFEQLKAGFKRLAEERNSPVPGIKYEEKEGALLSRSSTGASGSACVSDALRELCMWRMFWS